MKNQAKNIKFVIVFAIKFNLISLKYFLKYLFLKINYKIKFIIY